MPLDVLAVIAHESAAQQVAELMHSVPVVAVGPLSGVMLLGRPVAQLLKRGGAQVAEADDHAAAEDPAGRVPRGFSNPAPAFGVVPYTRRCSRQCGRALLDRQQVRGEYLLLRWRGKVDAGRPRHADPHDRGSGCGVEALLVLVNGDAALGPAAGIREFGPDIEPPGLVVSRPRKDHDDRSVPAQPVVQVRSVRGPLEAVLGLEHEATGGGLALYHDHEIERRTVWADKLDLAIDPVVYSPVMPQVAHLVHPLRDQRHAALTGQRLLRDLLPPRRHDTPRIDGAIHSPPRPSSALSYHRGYGLSATTRSGRGRFAEEKQLSPRGRCAA